MCHESFFLCVYQSEHSSTEDATKIRCVSDGSTDQDEMNNSTDRSAGATSFSFFSCVI